MNRSAPSPRAFLVSLTLMGTTAACSAFEESEYPTIEVPFYESVLDGDTLLVDGKAIRIKSLDAPELGPWASCWAEAALAGAAKSQLETELQRDSWKLVDIEEAADGKLSARIVNRDGFDIADTMRVHGYAAMTDGNWDWCGQDEPFSEPRQSGSPPVGPNLWWPSNKMYDPRVAD